MKMSGEFGGLRDKINRIFHGFLLSNYKWNLELNGFQTQRGFQLFTKYKLISLLFC